LAQLKRPWGPHKIKDFQPSPRAARPERTRAPHERTTRDEEDASEPGGAAMSNALVTNTSDSGAGSLRQAIIDANNGGGTITFAASLANATILAGSVANGPLPAINADVSISNVAIINGAAVGGAGGSGGDESGGGGGGMGAGGAIFVNAGTTTLSNVAFTGNNATGGKGGALITPGPEERNYVDEAGGGGGLGGAGGSASEESSGGGGGYSGGGGGA
jgi:hypothetical protein